jgi:enamine deaminase RidA (YjgF/YER057c/UK114 family)
MSSAAAVVKEIISTPNAPPALASYSQAVRAGNTLYWSETIPLPRAMRIAAYSGSARLDGAGLGSELAVRLVDSMLVVAG